MRASLVVILSLFSVISANGQEVPDRAWTADSTLANEGSCTIYLHDYVDLGNVPVGQQHSEEWDVVEFSDNICTIIGTVTKGLDPPFSGGGGFFLKYNGDFQQMNLTFAPTSIGRFHQTMTFNVEYSYNYGQSAYAEVQVVGNGVAPPSNVAEPTDASTLPAHISTISSTSANINVSFSLHASQTVRVILYDIQGYEVAQQSIAMLEPGVHAVSFERGGLPSGLYRVQLETGTGSTGRWISVLR